MGAWATSPLFELVFPKVEVGLVLVVVLDLVLLILRVVVVGGGWHPKVGLVAGIPM